MFETSEQRIKLLKAGFSGKEIEGLYVEYNNFRIVYPPILYELKEFNGVKSLNLERAARLHKPEVSIAMRQLKERDWVNEREEKKPGRGRPNKIYSLKVGFNDIIAQLEKQQKNKKPEGYRA